MKAGLFLASVAALSLVAGCENFTRKTTPSSVSPDPVVASENARLKRQLEDAEAEKAGMQKDLVAREGDISAAKLDSEAWRAKYEAAKEAMPAGGEPVPADLMKAFIELARAGGPWEVGEGGTLKAGSDVLFDSGKTDIKPAGQSALKEIAPKLKNILADKRVVLAVEGHTDSDPVKRSAFKFEDNTHLSLMRAHAVVAFLTAQGIPPAALRAVGLGEFHPVASNATKEGKALNRRVELRLLNAGSAPATTSAPEAEPVPK
jgi:chemotaxis protein MotB